MKRRIFALLIVALLSSLFAEEDMEQISEAFGHIISKNIKRIDVEFDMMRVIKGMQDGERRESWEARGKDKAHAKLDKTSRKYGVC